MAALARDLSKQILSSTDASRTFQPWWEGSKDGITYSMVVIGLITLPMTFLTGTPIECALHPDLWWNNGTNFLHYNITNYKPPRYARYLHNYAKKFCTENNVSPFLLYFPFMLFLCPLTLVLIRKFFFSIYNSESRLEMFYSMILKDNLEREDVACMEIETMKNSNEIQQSFRNSSGCYHSYIYRTSVELLASLLFEYFFCSFRKIDGISGATFECTLHHLPFTCIIPNCNFFWAMFYIAQTLLIFYNISCIFALIWILHPRVGRLPRILSGCQRLEKKTILNGMASYSDSFKLLPPGSLGTGSMTSSTSSSKMSPFIRLDMYYDTKAKDFRLLMNLLAENNVRGGIAQSLRILAIFDKHFQQLWRIQDIKIIFQPCFTAYGEFNPEVSHHEDKCYGFADPGDCSKDCRTFDQKLPCETMTSTILVFWNDALFSDYMYKKDSHRSILEYTAEITPHTEAPVKSLLYYSIPDLSDGKCKLQRSNSTGDNALSRWHKYCARFDGLESGKEYVISISTELDGRTITQVNNKVYKPPHECPTRKKSREKMK